MEAQEAAVNQTRLVHDSYVVALTAHRDHQMIQKMPEMQLENTSDVVYDGTTP